MNKLGMAHFLGAAVTAASLVTGATGAYAQAYPTKVVRVIAPFAPGGGTDFIARVVAAQLSAVMGQQFIVDNRPGAGGMLGAERGAQTPLSPRKPHRTATRSP
jgi:tripartite-type tricarboxylate transporter receptor subunit TctC